MWWTRNQTTEEEDNNNNDDDDESLRKSTPYPDYGGFSPQQQQPRQRSSRFVQQQQQHDDDHDAPQLLQQQHPATATTYSRVGGGGGQQQQKRKRHKRHLFFTQWMQRQRLRLLPWWWWWSKNSTTNKNHQSGYCCSIKPWSSHHHHLIKNNTRKRCYHNSSSVAVVGMIAVIIVITVIIIVVESNYVHYYYAKQWWIYLRRYHRCWFRGDNDDIPSKLHTDQHLQQLDIVHQQIVQQVQQKQSTRTTQGSRRDTTATNTQPRILRLHPSFLARPPFVPTEPTVLVPSTSDGDVDEHKPKPWQCTLQSPHAQHLWNMIRIVVFQRNGGKQLQTFLTHYLSVLPPDSLVIIDHESYRNSWTSQILSQYTTNNNNNNNTSTSSSTTGGHVHVWNCHGSYERHRADMWSAVVRAYQYDSAIVIPVDVDELLTTVVNNNDNNHPNNNNNNNNNYYPYSNVTRLIWDTHSLYTTLSDLLKLHRNDTGGKPYQSGKPFKMQWAEPIPGDCHVNIPSDNIDEATASTTTKSTTTHNNNNNNNKMLFPCPICDLSYLVVDIRPMPYACMHKCGAHGSDFVQTDMGNHFLVTQRTVDLFPASLFHYPSSYNIVDQCMEQGVTDYFDL